MKWKVCGLRDNIQEVVELLPDYAGFIFYPKSPRYVGEDFIMPPMSATIKKVGVFVNATAEVVLAKAKKCHLDFVQLHGAETPGYCKDIRKTGVGVIKAFSIAGKHDFAATSAYMDVADYFLYDTKTDLHGGSGQRFEWSMLNEYAPNKPYFLSGGISPENIQELMELNLQNIHAIDVNSKFEIKPGLKDVERLKEIEGRLN